MLPAAWEMLVEDTLTTDSSLPSSLTSRVRMSSSNTAIVLLRSAESKKKKKLQKEALFIEQTVNRSHGISCSFDH